ncbi:MAG: bacillithiol biosynthesis cysteine-adding enzyme BshC [Candidatus Kapabacteria bacterium]|jgi:bacillithiol biosynthesis cysteine-adding enzyme BshC|nr:bacillithiol biosynthesis cysteine-adding enzyme BshC [Candidatus Kapabacteria bacterium]
MHNLPFDQLGFSRLFIDFVAQGKPIQSRFPANSALLESSAALEEKAASTPHRSAILEAISATMSGLERTPAQERSLKALQQPTSLTVITGQQVGLLGGALYTMLKGWTAVQTARNLAKKHSALEFVPVFWVEDNDHDIDEISNVSLINAQGEVYTLQGSWKLKPERVAAADVAYDESIEATVNEAIEALPNSEHSHSVATLISETYKPGTPVTQAFVRILQASLGETGILFVSAAELRKRGLFQEIVRKELASVGMAATLVERASAELTSNGYHAQAQASAVNLFVHTDGKRHKINTLEGNEHFQAGEMRYSKAELLAIADAEPHRFSPAVLLRPVVQDAIFPNAAYIGGPGEIAYLAQIAELYAHFGVAPTATISRHSATLTDKRTMQTCEKLGVEAEFFFRRYADIEQDIMHKQENKALAAALDTTKATIEQAFADLLPHITALDPTLAPTSDRMKHQALQGITDLEGKIRKAQKRLEETTLGKARKAASLLFPEGGLQERALPYIYFAAKVGFVALAPLMENITTNTPTAHFVVNIEE